MWEAETVSQNPEDHWLVSSEELMSPKLMKDCILQKNKNKTKEPGSKAHKESHIKLTSGSTHVS